MGRVIQRAIDRAIANKNKSNKSSQRVLYKRVETGETFTSREAAEKGGYSSTITGEAEKGGSSSRSRPSVSSEIAQREEARRQTDILQRKQVKVEQQKQAELRKVEQQKQAEAEIISRRFQYGETLAPVRKGGEVFAPALTPEFKEKQDVSFVESIREKGLGLVSSLSPAFKSERQKFELQRKGIIESERVALQQKVKEQARRESIVPQWQIISEQRKAQKGLEAEANRLQEKIDTGKISYNLAEERLKTIQLKKEKELDSFSKLQEEKITAGVLPFIKLEQQKSEEKIGTKLRESTYTGSGTFGLSEFILRSKTGKPLRAGISKLTELEKGSKRLLEQKSLSKFEELTGKRIFGKELEAGLKISSPFVSIGKGVLRRPVETGVAAGLGFGIGAGVSLVTPSLLTAAAGGSKAAAITLGAGKGLGWVAGGAFVGGTGLSVSTAPTREESYARFGEALAIGSAGYLGASLGAKSVTAARTQFAETKVDVKYKRFEPTKSIKQRAKLIKSKVDYIQESGFKRADIKKALSFPKETTKGLSRGVDVSIIKPGSQIRGIGKVSKGVIVKTRGQTRGVLEVPGKKIYIKGGGISRKGYLDITVKNILTGKTLGKKTMLDIFEPGYSVKSGKFFKVKQSVKNIRGERIEQRMFSKESKLFKKFKLKGIERTEAANIKKFRLEKQTIRTGKGLTKIKMGKKELIFGADKYGKPTISEKIISEKSLRKLSKPSKIKFGDEKLIPKTKIEKYIGDKFYRESYRPGSVVTRTDIKSGAEGIFTIKETTPVTRGVKDIKFSFGKMFLSKKGATSVGIIDSKLSTKFDSVTVPRVGGKFSKGSAREISRVGNIISNIPKTSVSPFVVIPTKIFSTSRLNLDKISKTKLNLGERLSQNELTRQRLNQLQDITPMIDTIPKVIDLTKVGTKTRLTQLTQQIKITPQTPTTTFKSPDLSFPPLFPTIKIPPYDWDFGDGGGRGLLGLGKRIRGKGKYRPSLYGIEKFKATGFKGIGKMPRLTAGIGLRPVFKAPKKLKLLRL